MRAWHKGLAKVRRHDGVNSSRRRRATGSSRRTRASCTLTAARKLSGRAAWSAAAPSRAEGESDPSRTSPSSRTLPSPPTPPSPAPSPSHSGGEPQPSDPVTLRGRQLLMFMDTSTPRAVLSAPCCRKRRKVRTSAKRIGERHDLLHDKSKGRSEVRTFPPPCNRLKRGSQLPTPDVIA